MTAIRGGGTWWGVAALVLAMSINGTAGEGPRERYERARLLEENARKLDSAIALYEQVVAESGGDRVIAAAARLRIALLKERQGKPEARAAFEVLLRDYPEQHDVATTARARLATAFTTRGQAEIAPRRVLEGDWAGMADMSADGRLTVDILRTGFSAFDVVLRNVANGRTTTLVSGSNNRYGFQPRISPDGRYVAYAWKDDELRSLRIIGTEPGAVPQDIIGPSTTTMMPVTWSPDGGTLLVAIPEDDEESQSEGLKWMDLSSVSMRDKTVRRIKRFDGWQITLNPPIDARISPDGRHVAFSNLASEGATDRYLYVMEISGAGETPVVATAGRRSYPLWTPDGGRLLFRDHAGDRRRLMSLTIRDGRGSGEPSVLQADFTGTPLGITTSGAFYYTLSVGGGNYEYVVSRPMADDERPTVFAGLSASWSPDGRSVAFVRGGLQGLDLIVRDIATGHERSYRHAGITAVSPRWFADGTGLIAVIEEQAASESSRAFHLLDTRTGTFRRLFDRDSASRHRTAVGTLAPDGKTLYLAARTPATGPMTEIVGVDISTGEERHIAALPPDTAQGGIGLAISPDGTTLAVAVFTEPWVRARIFTVRTDGSNYREVCGPFETGWVPDNVRWTPDGRSLVFVAHDANRNWRVMRVPAEGGQPQFDGLSYETMQPLIPDLRMWPGNFNNIDLSPDGTRIIASSLTFSKSELWSLDNVLTIR